MPKKWNPGQERKFCRELQLGKPYYVVHNVERRVAPYEDAQLYSEYVFTKRLPITGTPCTEHGASASTLLRQHGPIYDAPPRGMRNLADPAPQVAGPLPKGYTARLDEAEIRGLEKRVADMPDPKKRRWGR
ncbi:hypothetical protein ACIG0D_27315 [Streptomyces sp. NPDC052773]|uniref:hypothetical protein n=1 Tax=Streptomyces sp. NPDC052773 TaxID=3365693 RepID=UPI0037D3CB4A